MLGPFLEEVLGWLRGHAPHEPRRVADMGAGTGAGSLALARRFPAAEIIAIDRSSVMIDRVREAARAEGLGDRLRVAEADLDAAWPAIGALDVVWAASSLHHVADPGRVLRDIHAALNPGGLLAVIEMDALPRFLPDDFGLGRPGLEARCHEAAAQAGWNAHPDWGPHLEQAGFELAEQRSFSIEPSPSPTPADASAPGLAAPDSVASAPVAPGSGASGSVPSAVARYAYAVLSGFRAALHDRLDATDLGTLDRLLAEDSPDGLLNRRDLTLRGTRTVWAARRPSA
ncbi:class I SAM-dependent methyltransferase [Nonomuraea rosea]|uniref:Class I SAM-dependent methyltransferase n=1 Tax=Nonomuraea rosea TaxID=638574 RepID=A0ABP6YWA9_9ACTN